MQKKVNKIEPSVPIRVLNKVLADMAFEGEILIRQSITIFDRLLVELKREKGIS